MKHFYLITDDYKSKCYLISKKWQINPTELLLNTLILQVCTDFKNRGRDEGRYENYLLLFGNTYIITNQNIF